MKNVVGKSLISDRELSQQIKISLEYFRAFARAGFFDKWSELSPTCETDQRFPSRLLYNEKDIPNIKNTIEEHMFSKEKIPQGMIMDVYLARKIGIKLPQLLKQIEDGKWEGHIRKEMFMPSHPRIVYLFDDEAHLSSPYLSVGMLPEVIDVSPPSLSKYIKNGDLEQPHHLKGTMMWDVNRVREQIPLIMNKYRTHLSEKNKKHSSYNLLTLDQKKWIQDYIDYRLAGSKIIFEDRPIYTKTMLNTDKVIQRKRNDIASFLTKVAAIRCGLDATHEVMIKSSKMNCEVLDLNQFDINRLDISKVVKGKPPGHINRLSKEATGFLYYQLMILEETYPSWRTDAKQMENYHLRRSKLLSAINSFPEKNEMNLKKREKVFLERRQVIEIYQEIMRGGKKVPAMLNYRRNATIWMVACFTGLRPEEMKELRIEHFALDEDGYLQKNKSRYGLLKFPREFSKGGYSPSHPQLGTLVVPQLVDLINNYLKHEIYKYQNTKGKGFLFRNSSLKGDEDGGLRSISEWLRIHKQLFTGILSQQEVSALQLKSSRHSMNNFFETSNLDPKLSGYRKRAAQIQMRHDISKNSGTIGEKHYTDEISPFYYFSVVDKVLNFPWNLNDLQEWEVSNGYEQKKVSIKTPNSFYEFDDGDNDSSSVITPTSVKEAAVTKEFSNIEEIEENSKRILEASRKETEKMSSEKKTLIEELNVINQRLKELRTGQDKTIEIFERLRTIKYLNEQEGLLKAKISRL